jgi:hypothetical protein
MSLFSTPELEKRFVEAIEKIAANSERRGSQGTPKPVECFVCKNRGKVVMINLKRKSAELVKEGESPFNLFNLDGSPHEHSMGPQTSKPAESAKPEPPSEKKTPTAAANTDQVMNFLKGIWPTPGGPAVTDCGDHWRVASPYLEDRDQWRELAKAIREELGGEYISDKENREFYFVIPKPKVPKP